MKYSVIFSGMDREAEAAKLGHANQVLGPSDSSSCCALYRSSSPMVNQGKMGLDEGLQLHHLPQTPESNCSIA